MKAIKAKAREYGLDFFEVVYEKLDFDTMNQIAAYGGFPIRYPHWKLGHGVRQAQQARRLRPRAHLRDGHQQRPLLRVPAGDPTRSPTRSS
jgi:spore cortex formation protein SpoVR/YcgB (stage V sporulation)